MPGLDGFAVLKELLDKKLGLPQVVFATAFDQYAVRAFEVNAVDYLLKPFDRKRVLKTIEKVQARIAAKAGLEVPASDAPTTDARLEELLRLVETRTQPVRTHTGKVIVRAQGGFCWSTRRRYASSRSKAGRSAWLRAGWRASRTAVRWMS